MNQLKPSILGRVRRNACTLIELKTGFAELNLAASPEPWVWSFGNPFRRAIGLAGPVQALLLSLAPWLAGAAEFSFFEPVQPARALQVMAHRGEAHQAPENTRAALERCIEDGLEWADVDVRRTRDGQHVLAHDPSVSLGSGRSLEISEHTLPALKRVDVGSRFAARFADERLLSISEALALCKRRLNLCLNCDAVDPEQLTAEILQAGMERQVMIYSDLAQLQRVTRASGGKVAILARWRPGRGGPEWAVNNGLTAVEIDAKDFNAALRAGFKAAGIRVGVKLLDSPDQPEVWERVFAAGPDWVRTDVPEEVAASALWRRLPSRPVEISLHRGASRYAPENTLPAFAKANRLGADYVEFDVRATANGAFFLLHDSRLDRTTDGTGPIDRITSAALRNLSAGVKFGREYYAVRVLSLEEFLERFAPKVGLYFDAKAIPPSALADALQRHHAIERTVVYQTPEYLEQLKGINPGIRRLVPLSRPQDLEELVARFEPYAFDADWDILSKDLIARCHALGVRVFSDALGEHERVKDYLQAMEWGIDLIQTDHPLRVLRAIELRVAGKTSPAIGKP